MRTKKQKVVKEKITVKDLIFHLAGKIAYLEDENCENSGTNWFYGEFLQMFNKVK